jgi:salicylate hydroxylase
VFTDDGVDAVAWDRAISDFNSARVARTARVQRTARIWGESWHVSGVARTLRNLLFKSRKDGDFQYNDWLYGQAGDGVPAAAAAAAAGAATDAAVDVRAKAEVRTESLAGTHA